MLLNVEHLYKYFNGQALLKDINFTVEDREAVGLIGINGCGKSTLLNIITGSEGYDKTPEGLGSVNIAGKASIGFLRQNSGLNSELTIGEEMKNAFAPLLETLDKMKVLEKKMADGGDIDSIRALVMLSVSCIFLFAISSSCSRYCLVASSRFISSFCFPMIKSLRS